MKQQRLLCDSLTFSAHDSRRYCNLHDCVQLRRLETEFLALQRTAVLLKSQTGTATTYKKLQVNGSPVWNAHPGMHVCTNEQTTQKHTNEAPFTEWAEA